MQFKIVEMCRGGVLAGTCSLSQVQMTWIALNSAKVSYCRILVDDIQMGHNGNPGHRYTKPQSLSNRIRFCVQ